MTSLKCLTFAWFLLLQSVVKHGRCQNETTRKIYMIGFMDNKLNGFLKLSLHIVNTGENTTCVYYKTKGTQLVNISLPGRTTQVVPFSEDYMAKGSGRKQKGIRVETDGQVIVYGVNRFNKSGKHSMDGFLSVPVTYADTRFYAVTLSRSSQILLVGEINGTLVNVVLPPTSCMVRLNSTKYGEGDVINITLDEYETIQLQCDQNCLTGTVINASHPISVFSGNKRRNLPQITNEVGHSVEQIPSVNSWGMHFVNIPPANDSYTCKIVAAYPDTTVNFTCSDNTSTTLLVTGTNYHQTHDQLTTICILTANRPILVTLFIGTMKLDPSMVLIPPVKELINDVLYFYVPSSVKFWLVFVTNASAIHVDGKQHKLNAVENIPGFFRDILLIESSGIHNISLSKNTLITGYIHGRDGKRAISYPLLQHRQQSSDNVEPNFPQGPCERNAIAETSNVNVPTETTSSTQEMMTTPPVASTQEMVTTSPEAFLAGTTSSQELTSSVRTTTLSRSFEKTTLRSIIYPTVLSTKTCSCLQHNCSMTPSMEEMKQIITKLRAELLIRPKKTNRYKRSLTSVWDERRSAQALGYGASIILGAMGIGIVMLDLNNLIVMVKRIRRNLLSRSCHN